MADNVDITPGSGKTVRADEVGGVLVQVVKVALGADGAEDLLVDSGQQTKANSVPVVIASDQDSLPTTPTASENHLGEVGGNLKLIQVTFSLDTNAYAAGDLLADTQIITACMRKDVGSGYLQSVMINDKDDQGQPFDVYIIQTNVSMGTENAAPSITDANADKILGFFSVASADYKDLGGCKVANLRNLGIPVVADTGADDLYVALVTQGAPTHTASGITAWFGFDNN